MRFEILTVNMFMLIFWVVMLYELTGTQQHFWRNILPPLSEFQQYVPLKHWCLPTSPYGVKTQKINTGIY
jgi:hypothetical protein